MISMCVIDSIRRKRMDGASVASIARDLEVSEPTVRKYLKVDDLSPKPPVRASRSSVIDEYVPLIEQWLAEDRDSWSKQRHTAVRIYQRLVDEHGVTFSRSTVSRKVRELKQQFAFERQQGFLDLTWHEGEAQADFGQVDVIWKAMKRRMHVFVLSFPFSNTAVATLMPAENAECTCQALQDLFTRLGGVPRRIVFDNAAGIGHKKRDGSITYTKVFEAFRAHYGFESSLCNPYSGHEKGNVEAKVGAIRRALFVPTPKAWTYETFNQQLFDRCMDMAKKAHYRKGDDEIALFEQDRQHLRPLPDKPFTVVSFQRMKADKYGAITLQGKHRYLAGLEYAGRELIVGLKALSVQLADGQGKAIISHERAYGDNPTSSEEPIQQLEALARRANAWPNSQVRDQLPDNLRDFIDQKDRIGRQGILRTMALTSRDNGWERTIQAMDSVLTATGSLERSSIDLHIARLAAGNDPIQYDDTVDLTEYDIAFSHPTNDDEVTS